MGINAVSVIAPRQEQHEQKEKKKDWTERLIEGLQIAKGLTGITVDYQQIQKYREDRATNADITAGIGTQKDKAGLMQNDMTVVAKDTPGSQVFRFRNGEQIEETPLMKAAKPAAPLGGSYQTVAGPDGKPVKKWLPNGGPDQPAYVKPDEGKAPTSRTRPDGVMEEWDSTAKGGKGDWKVVAKKPTTPKDEAFASLPKPDQIIVTDLTKDIAGKASIANMIDSQLANFKKSWQDGNKDLAIQQGNEMLKALNSDQGKDAVGAEEAKRLAAFLEYQVLNFTGPGDVFGRNLDQFYSQAAQKTNAIKNTIKSNQKIIDDIYAGKGSPALSETDPTLGPQKGDGTALAGTGFKPQRKQSPKDGKWYVETAPNEWELDPNQGK